MTTSVTTSVNSPELQYRGIPACGNINDPDILLLSVNAGYIHAHIGLRYLLANLGELQGRAGILEGTRRSGVLNLAAAATSLKPRIIGISVSIWNHRESQELMELIRKELPDVLMVVGGPEASYLDESHELFVNADVLIRGEAELSFTELCREYLAASGPGWVGEAGEAGRSLQVIEAGPPDLKNISLPYSLLSDSDLKNRLIYVETSRGCPFSCEFCLSSVQGRVRTFPLEPVLDSVRDMYERGGRYFKLIDRTFNIDIARARRTLQFFLELFSRQDQPGAYVQFEVVPDRMPHELREIIQQFPAGSLRLEIGIQTFNNDVAARINRRQDQQRTLDNLAFLSRETEAVLHADLIIGLPGEDLASFAAGFDRLWEMQPGEIQLGVLKALPGTTLHRHDAEYGMVYSPDPPYEILETGVISRELMNDLKAAAKFWELVVNRGRYPRQVQNLIPVGARAFYRFLELSRYLFRHFDRTWGIDAAELGRLLDEYSAAEIT